jgi:DNA polymerase-1
VVTGRLAASDPNLLAQPEHGKFATEFKRGWVAEPGHIICQWDESQVELRGLAHLSQDPVLLAVYRGEARNPDGSLIDLHAKLAQRIFGGPIEQYMHKCAGRLAAKAINFGIPMGMTNRGLSVELRKNGVEADEDTAQRWLDETLALYTGVAAFMEHRKEEARRNGFVRCMSGRIRYIGGIRSKDDRVREEAERFAFSTPIQESATFIMKQAEKIVYEDILVPYWRQGRWVEPLLQVHDCLKLEAEEGMEQELNVLMTEAMTQVPIGFSVSLAVEGEYGYNMADMRSF